MPSKFPVSMAARERLRDHQAATAKAMSAHGTALARLDAVIARREVALAAQDALVTAASAKVAAAVATLVKLMGVDGAANLLGLTKSEVRRATKGAEVGQG